MGTVTVGDVAKSCETLRVTVACLVVVVALGIALVIG